MFSGGKLTLNDLPIELRKELMRVYKPLTWRPRTLEKVFAGLEAQIIISRRGNDYSHWQRCESIGNKIREWIDADPKRQVAFDEGCIPTGAEDDVDPFYK